MQLKYANLTETDCIDETLPIESKCIEVEMTLTKVDANKCLFARVYNVVMWLSAQFSECRSVLIKT